MMNDCPAKNWHKKKLIKGNLTAVDMKRFIAKMLPPATPNNLRLHDIGKMSL